MLLITCPWCGPRDETEYHYGGQAHVPYPEDPAALTDEEWAAYLFFRDNPKGPFAERWVHSRRLPPLVQRRARHRDVRGAGGLPPERPRAAQRRRHPMTDQRTGSPTAAASTAARVLRFTVDGVELAGHPGDTLASALLANGSVEVGAVALPRPPARHRRRRRRGAQRPGADRRRRARSRCCPPRRPSCTTACPPRRCPGWAGSTRPPTRPSTTRSTSTPTSWSSAPARPGSGRRRAAAAPAPA